MASFTPVPTPASGPPKAVAATVLATDRIRSRDVVRAIPPPGPRAGGPILAVAAAGVQLRVSATLRRVENAEIADRLDALASLLELADGEPLLGARVPPRRRARSARPGGPVAELVRAGRVRALRGIGQGIEARLRELVETGEIAELAELERELPPDLVGLGRYLGLGAKRSVEIARALGVRTADELREAAAAGRLRGVPGIGPKTEARLREALAREGEPRRAAGHAPAPRAGARRRHRRPRSDGEPAGDVRRWRDASERLAVVCAAADPGAGARALRRAARRSSRCSSARSAARSGVTLEGVPIELIAAEPERFGTALLRATGSAAYVAGARAAARRARRGGRLPRARRPVVPAGAARGSRSAASRPPLRRARRHPRRSALPHDLVRRPGERRGDGPRRPRARLRLPRDLRPHARRRRGAGAHRRTTSAARARRSRRPTSGWRRSACCAGSSATSCPTGGSTCPTTCWRSSTGCRRASTAASACREREMTTAGRGGAAQPVRALPQPPEGPLHQPAPRERARPRARVRGRARGGRRARGQRPARSGSTCAASTSATRSRRASRSSARPTPTPSAGSDNMPFAVATARRGWATAASVVNTRPWPAIATRRARR